MTNLFGTAELEIRGTLTRIYWQENGRVIAAVRAPGHRALTVIGDMLEPVEGQEYVFYGQLGPNARRPGEQQLSLAGYRTILPESDAGIYHYLVSVAKWVGPRVADAIVKAFGPNR